MTMKEQLRALIEQKIAEWKREGIYENIYAVSLYVFHEEDDPRRPVAVLGYNTEEQAQESASQASDEQEARWNYAFWLQNEELCWGLGDTAEAVKQWIAGQGLEDGDEIAGAFLEMLMEVVRKLHASGLLKNRRGEELPILIHGLEYDGETARQNLEANGKALDKDFLAFCGLEQNVPHMGWRNAPERFMECRKEDHSEKEPIPLPQFSYTSDIPRRFNCGQRKVDMRHVLAFILIILFVMFTLGMYSILGDGPDAAPEIEENGQVGQRTAEDGDAFKPAETEERSAVSDSQEGDRAAIESVLTVKPGQEQAASAAAVENEPDAVPKDGEESAMRWQIYIHPDVPEPLEEVLEQYEKVMEADFDLEEFSDRNSDKWEELNIEDLYVYDEVYCKWRYATGDERDVSICYSLEDLTGDGIPELIMGSGADTDDGEIRRSGRHMEIKLIRAGVEDAKEIHAMQLEAFRELLEKYQDFDTSPASEGVEKVEARLRQNFTYYYFICMGPQRVGAIRIVDKKETGKNKRISPLFVLPRFQGQGIGQKAIRMCEELHGGTDWELETILREEKNCYLYEKMGYRRTGRTEAVNERLTLVFYEKK